jgi:biopolymer transport protein ExbD
MAFNMSALNRNAGARALAGPYAEPNVIPFIDVLLVLLVIFMVTAPRPNVDIPVDLPQQGPAIVLGAPTIVALRELGGRLQIFVGEEAVDGLEILGDRTMAHVMVNNPRLTLEQMHAEARVLVRADQITAYGNVVAVLDQLKRDGFVEVGIFAETAQDS